MKITACTRKALAILRDHGPQRPSEFAKRMWPNSPKWNVHYKCGPRGSHQGGAMSQAGGAYLGKLRKAGLVADGWWPQPYRITERGKQGLEMHE